ncbi:MAG: signal peptide peptidase SppA [Oligoflexia bacterium]|nr:signal peptide peptidase SppA [Oligoflexia bacterium]
MKDYFVWLLKTLTLIVIVLVLIPVMIGAIFGSLESDFNPIAGHNKNIVAVVEVTGVIESAREIVEQLHKQVADKDVKGVVLRINSPGGAVAPSQEIFSAVMKLKAQKPIVASMGNMAASGGLYSAVGASKVFCQPGTLTGSIGVIMNLPNFHDLAEKVGFKMMTIKSGKFKDVGNSFREMAPEEKELLEATINKVQDDFVNAVATGRGMEAAKVREFADGRVIIGTQAKELNLVDGFGDVYDAARAVFDLRGEPLAADEAPELVYPMDKLSQVRKFFDSISWIPRIFSRSLELQYLMP